MKTAHFIIIGIVLGCSCQIQIHPYKKKAILSIRNQIQALGSIDLDSTRIIPFTLYNAGDKDLIVDSVSASCDCTVPNFIKRTIHPKDSTVLFISYKPVNTGDFDKAVVIKSNIDSSFSVIRFYGKAVKSITRAEKK